jgi:2,4-dienoyl-CoA reductase-like NADH-dependent reductase (Old Yellow Enzyme family)
MFEPLPLGHLTLRNRIVQAAHERGFSPHGAATQREVEYLVQRIRGGAGLVMTSARTIHMSATGLGQFASGYARATTAADTRLTTAIHDAGGAIFAQLNHFGAQSPTDGIDELHELWSASAVGSPALGITPRALEADDIDAVTEGWAAAAARARDGGFDGVEVQLGHGYLIHQFLSPMFNHRDDEYGGSLENRCRLGRRVLAAVRNRVGDDYVVGVRISVGDLLPGGLQPPDMIDIGRLLAADTQIDFWNVTGPGHHNFVMSLPSLDGPPDGWLADYAGRLRAALSGTVVFLGGGVRTPERVEAILRAGQADAVALTREQIADPDWANKARAGKTHQIYRCIRANQGCFARVSRSLPMACTVNPLAGREAIFSGRMAPTSTPRHWLVVGGGPAGLKAAETLARRGHHVTLAERSDALGGQVRLILRSGHRQDMGFIVGDLEAQLADLDVDVQRGVELDRRAVQEIGADRIVIATGARADRTGFTTFMAGVRTLPGHDADLVVTGMDVLAGVAQPRGRVVVLDDQGSRYTAGVVESLLDAGCEVELVTPMNALFAQTAPTIDQPGIYARVLPGRFSSRLNSWAQRVDSASVVVVNLYTGQTEVIAADAVVLVTRRLAEDGLYRECRTGGVPVIRIGDCLAPRLLDHAIFDGFLTGIEMDRSELPQQGLLTDLPSS